MRLWQRFGYVSSNCLVPYISVLYSICLICVKTVYIAFHSWWCFQALPVFLWFYCRLAVMLPFFVMAILFLWWLDCCYFPASYLVKVTWNLVSLKCAIMASISAMITHTPLTFSNFSEVELCKNCDMVTWKSKCDTKNYESSTWCIISDTFPGDISCCVKKGSRFTLFLV